MLAAAPVSAAPRSPRADSLAARVEPLFAAGAYDSILAILPGFIHEAQARADSVLLSRALTQRGRVYLMQGRRGDAVADIERGIAIAEAVRDTTGLMPAVYFRGLAYAGTGAWEDALRCYRRRLDLAQRVRSPLDEGWARTGIAYVHHLHGRDAEARAEYRRAIALFRAGGRTQLEITPLIGLGRVESAAGDQPEAIRCYQRAWVVARETGDRLNEMWATNNLGVLEETFGDLSRAAEYQTRAFQIARELGYPEGMVVPAINLAMRALEQGDFAHADAILQETRALCVEKSEPTYLDVVDYSIAELRLAEGRTREAADILRRVLTPIDRLGPQHRGPAMLGYARALAASDSVSEAIAWLEARRAAGDFAYGDVQSYGALQTAWLYGEAGRYGQAIAFAAHAHELAEAAGQWRVVVAASLRESIYQRALGRPGEAAVALNAAVEHLEAFRGGISSAEWREVYGQETSRAVLEAARVLLVHPDSLAAPARARAFFDTMQRFKTRTLLDRISDPRFGPGTLPGRRDPATLTETQSALRAGELLLDFFAGDVVTLLCAITPDSCRVVELPGSRSPLAGRADVFRRIVTSADAAARADFPPERIAGMQRALGREVLGGVADLIAASERVFVSPDGFYAKIPFGILMLDDAPLLASRDVLLVPSASLLAAGRAGNRAVCDGPARVLALGLDEGGRLPGARDEVNSLARRYRRVDRITSLAGGDALAGALEPCDVLHVAAHALVIDQSPWDSGIRIRGGGGGETAAVRTADEPSPARAILSSADSMLVARTFPGDPYLRAWRIASLSLPARLAVLAACETAGGRVTTGEGTLGITAAFLSAGVPVVVSSLWPVDDRATERVMTAFYRRLAAGTPVARALREAQLEVSGATGMAHPFLWAGFTVVGDGTGTVALDRRGHPLLALLVALTAGLVLAVAIVRRRRAPAAMR